MASRVARERARREAQLSKRQALATRTSLSVKRASALVDKNSRTIVKLSQLLEVYNKPGASEVDSRGVVARRIERYKHRVARRLNKLAKFVDTPESERPYDRPPAKPVASRVQYRYKPSAVRKQLPRTLTLPPSPPLHPSPEREKERTTVAAPNAGMSAESERQYFFGWKRYTEFCDQQGYDPMGEGGDVALQVLQFAKYLMEHPEKSVKPAAANSYVSAVGKKLVDSNVVSSMRDIRTPEMKELFASFESKRRQQLQEIVGNTFRVGNIAPGAVPSRTSTDAN